MFGNSALKPQERFDENTLFKVYDALRKDCGLSEDQSREAITAIQNRGILFRERIEPPAAVGVLPLKIRQETGNVDDVDTESTVS